MLVTYARHSVRNYIGLTLAITGMAFAAAGVEAFVGILYLANYTPLLPNIDGLTALAIVSAVEGLALLLGVVALPLLRYASRAFKGFAWITIGSSLLIACSIAWLMFVMSAFADG